MTRRLLRGLLAFLVASFLVLAAEVALVALHSGAAALYRPMLPFLARRLPRDGEVYRALRAHFPGAARDYAELHGHMLVGVAMLVCAGAAGLVAGAIQAARRPGSEEKR